MKLETRENIKHNCHEKRGEQGSREEDAKGAYSFVSDRSLTTDDAVIRRIKKLPKDASRSKAQGASRRGVYSFVHDSRRATEPEEMRSIFGQRGVTLVELVVVIAIVFILGSLAVVEYGNMSERAVRNDAIVMAKSLTNAMKMYKFENNSEYPPAGDLTPLVSYIDHLTEIAQNHFTKVEISKLGNGVAVLGAVKDLDDEYCISYVAENGSDAQFQRAGSPHCRWADIDGKCTGAVSKSYHHDWQACEVGL